MPVDVNLTRAKRSIYTSGVSYGTDSGAGIRLGVERRYVNMRGHKALAQVDYANKRKTATLQHRIPAFAWLDGWSLTTLVDEFAEAYARRCAGDASTLPEPELQIADVALWQARHHDGEGLAQLSRHLCHGRTRGTGVQGKHGGAVGHKQDGARV